MAHFEAQVRWPDSLTDENIDRTDYSWARLRYSWARLRAGMYPEIPVDPEEIGPLTAYLLIRTLTRAAWLKAACINAKKSLATRGYCLATAADVHVADDVAASAYTMTHLLKLGAAARQVKAKLLGLRKADGSADVFVYSLSKGNTYLKRFRCAMEAQQRCE